MKGYTIILLICTALMLLDLLSERYGTNLQF